ncbi:MAG: hypothetical protein ABSC21_15130 [Terriglobia bacterium]|jgi:hypothetical protein
MSNEQYLIVSYFFVGVLSIVIAMAAYAFLRRPLAGLASAFPNRNLASVLKKLFPAGLVLPALAGFLSVSYQSCHQSYESIIADRSYLVGKNQQQISAICFFLMLAVLGWGVVVLLSLVTQPKQPGPGADGEPNRR